MAPLVPILVRSTGRPSKPFRFDVIVASPRCRRTAAARSSSLGEGHGDLRGAHGNKI